MVEIIDIFRIMTRICKEFNIPFKYKDMQYILNNKIVVCNWMWNILYNHSDLSEIERRFIDAMWLLLISHPNIYKNELVGCSKSSIENYLSSVLKYFETEFDITQHTIEECVEFYKEKIYKSCH